ncbi:MAG: hypothetical protein AAGA15_15375 [Pseudomonadota bacterium]
MNEVGKPVLRFAYDPLDLNPNLRIEANEKVTAFQFEALNKRLDRIDAMIVRLERRVWLTVYGVAAAILAQAFQSFLAVTP